MAAGLPVVALAAMGTIEILAPGRGCLAPAEDVPEFAHALVRLLSDRPFRQELSESARLEAARWSEESAAAGLAALYRATVAVPSRS